MGDLRWGMAIAGMLATAVGTASAQPAPSAQGKIVALNGRVEHTPALQEQFSAARMLQPLLVSERVRTLDPRHPIEACRGAVAM